MIGCAPVKRGVRTSAIVKFQIATDRRARLRDALVGLEVDLLILQGPPEALQEHVVASGTLAVHADRDAVVNASLVNWLP